MHKTYKKTKEITIKFKSYNTIHDKYHPAACFGTGVSSSWSLLQQMNKTPTLQFRY